MKKTNKQLIDKYTCRNCGFILLTKRLEKGEILKMLPCRVNNCNSYMSHSIFNSTDKRLVFDFYWKKPSEKEYKKLDEKSKEYIDSDGLILIEKS